MDNPSGIIRSLYDQRGRVCAVVAVDAGAACPRCAAGKGCGAGLLAPGGRERLIEAAVRYPGSVAEGDQVELSMHPAHLLSAAFTVYAMPLLGAVAGAVIAYYFAWSDAMAVVAVAGGVVSGFLAGRRRLSRNRCLSTLVPVVERRLQAR